MPRVVGQLLRFSQALALVATDFVREAGRTQQDLADAARASGLDWTRSSVAALRAGTRTLTAEEYLLLPMLVGRVTGGVVTHEGLLGRIEEPFLLGGYPLSDGEVLVNLFLGELPPIFHTSGATEPFTVLVDRGHVEQHVAVRMGEPYEAVRDAAFALYGHGLDVERDRRAGVDEQTEHSAAGNLASLAARRGHATREFVEELAQHFLGERLKREQASARGQAGARAAAEAYLDRARADERADERGSA